jgi:signal transduction histidine kinase
MRKIFLKALLFIKDNITIVYSLLLALLIPGAFFVNNYLVNSSYEKNIDQIIQRKAVTVENIINVFLLNEVDSQKIQEAIMKIISENPEIISLSVLRPVAGGGDFSVLASNNLESVGKSTQNTVQNVLAWSQPDGIAFLGKNAGGRFWQVTKAFKNATGGKIGLLEVSFSLSDSDALIDRTIYNSYIVMILTILVVVLLVANQARLLGYAVSLTRLKEIDKMKDMFISMASHELRTPLAAIKGYLELLGEKNIPDDKKAHYMENIFLSVGRLDNLVEDVLEVSRIEGNRLPMEISVFEPASTIIQSIEEISPQAIQKGLALNFEPVAPIKIKADQNRLKQILINLLGNAIKYTEKGSIDVKTFIKNDEFGILVADTGVGISAQDMPKLFQKFSRIKNDKTRDIIGTGLGLWVAFEIAKRMQGRIAVESIEGVGSHFTVWLPISK